MGQMSLPGVPGMTVDSKIGIQTLSSTLMVGLFMKVYEGSLSRLHSSLLQCFGRTQDTNIISTKFHKKCISISIYIFFIYMPCCMLPIC